MSQYIKKLRKNMHNKKPLVSIIIVSYNTKDLLEACIASVEKFADIDYELIVSDNGSTDGTVEMLRKNTKVVLIENNKNLGFAKGNNVAKGKASGKYILFLNPDTLFTNKCLSETIGYLSNNANIGALTCKVLLPSGKLDKDTRRSFPTPFIALTHFSGLDKLFPKSQLFSRYWYGYKSENEIHEIDSLQGAFFLVQKAILDNVGWFDEDYFMDGEDIDLCFKIKEAGYSIMYYPKVSILHIKKASKKKNRSLKSVVGGVVAMETFYKKRLWSKNFLPINILVIVGIRILKSLRTIMFYITS